VLGLRRYAGRRMLWAFSWGLGRIASGSVRMGAALDPLTVAQRVPVALRSGHLFSDPAPSGASSRARRQELHQEHALHEMVDHRAKVHRVDRRGEELANGHRVEKEHQTRRECSNLIVLPCSC